MVQHRNYFLTVVSPTIMTCCFVGYMVGEEKRGGCIRVWREEFKVNKHNVRMATDDINVGFHKWFVYIMFVCLGYTLSM